MNIIGLDHCFSSLHLARGNGLQSIQGDAYHLPFKDNMFSMVTMFHFLEHCANPHSILKEVQRVLKKEGCLLIQVPNTASWQAKILGNYWYGYDAPRHVVNYNIFSLEKLLSNENFFTKIKNKFMIRDDAGIITISLFPKLYHQQPTIEGIFLFISKILYIICSLIFVPLAFLENRAGHGGTIVLQCRKKQ